MPDPDDELSTLINAAERRARSLDDGDDDGRAVATRLRDSIARPLRALVPEPWAAAKPDGDDVSLLDLAVTAATLAAEHPGPEVIEAAAALQDLALTAASDEERPQQLADLRARTAGLAPGIQVAADGPYLAINVVDLHDWLGLPLPDRPLRALCRCGESGIKPLCDGSHTGVGFSGARDPDRVPDHLDTYVGQQVTILDNRGTCQHSGLCTDRLATVFRLHEEPFVAPSGGRMDEIIRAVRDCPSGALSYAIDGVEARGDVDHNGTRPPAVEVSKDGPYRVVGGLPLVDEDGAAVPRNEGASTEHYALCRCGHAQNKPFCSGMHYYVEFRDPVPAPGHQPTMFEWAGGLPALTRMTRLFYEKHVPQDPLLAPLFAEMSADHPERVAKWLGEVFCGPTRYSAEYGGYPRMVSQHLGKGLTEEHRERWVTLLLRSAREAGLPNDAEFRSAFEAYIEWGSRLAVGNSQTGAQPPANMPMPHWDWNTAAGPPGSRISALAPPEETAADQPAVELPGPNEPVGFDAHIKALFRERDQRSMQFAFDLRSYDDVSTHADAILDRLRAGTMPCDGPWPDTWTDVFQRWVESGKGP